ncbi:MAG: ATP-binding cassette domain-containing protein, partial [Nitrososphaeria archaeon]|nr:ATP-binding cassette domain-containing protein [Nitrososphaeria archaeon]NIQ33846.1 ATP-binding cassette domain-containing protein [Nitrososphaeria archaeon]
MKMDMLTVKDVHKSFGGVKALDGASLKVKEHSIMGLIGPNGSGKTTLYNVVTGFYPPDMGEVLFRDESLIGLKPYETSLKGLARTFQITRVFPRMTVLENMLVAPTGQKGENLSSAFLKWRDVLNQEVAYAQKALRLLRFLEIDHLRDEYAGNLSGGQQKLLELGRILMMDPKIILLDEPVAGVNPTLAVKIFDKIKDLREEGDMTFVIVEHNMDVVMSFCDEIYVMNKGQVVAEGTPEEIQRDESVIEAYLG